MLAPALALFLLLLASTLVLAHPPASAGNISASSVQATASKAPWFLGAVTTQQATAQDTVAEFFIPQELPSVADTYYPLIMSAYDSNSSYDQIGIIAQYGKWAVTTSSTVVNGSTTVYDSLVWMELPSGYYWFRMGISGGAVTYSVLAENGSVLLNRMARTGGNYFLISPTFLNKYTFISYASYTIYEEVYNATGGAPPFNLLCRESYFISNGTEYHPIWTEYRAGNVPSGPSVSMNGSSVIIRNVAPSVTLSSDKSQYYTKEPISLSADAIGAVGEVTYSWYVDGLLASTSLGPEFNLTLGTASVHQVQARAQDFTGNLTSNVLDLAVTKVLLSLSSQLGTAVGGGLYDYGDQATVTVTPTALPTGAGTRVALTGWRSDSKDGYVGSNQSFVMSLEHNITEVAVWTNQSIVGFRSDPAGLVQDVWYNNGPENITLPAVWSNDTYSRMSLTGLTINGTFTSTGRKGRIFSTDLEGPLTLSLTGVKQYSIILEGYGGPYNSTSQTGDLWFDSGSDAFVNLPLNYTQGLTRQIFVDWAGGSSNPTVAYPEISSSHTLAPVFKLQYFVFIVGGNSITPIPVDLIDGPVAAQYFFSVNIGAKGAWFDSGSVIPPALEKWNQSGMSESRYTLYSVIVYFTANVTESRGIVTEAFSIAYGVTGGRINASSILGRSMSGEEVNGTFVPFQLPSDEAPKIEGGQLVVDRPLEVIYIYSPEFYFSLKTPFGGFEGWVAQSATSIGKFSYSAPVLAGFLGTQRFAGWTGTVNSTSPSLSLSVLKPYVEVASYTTDFGAVASVIMASAALVIGGYFMLWEHRRVSAG